MEQSYYEGALALGATHERSVFTVVVPAAKSGILAAVILGVGRALGETMAVMMVVGNQPRVPNSIDVYKRQDHRHTIIHACLPTAEEIAVCERYHINQMCIRDSRWMPEPWRGICSRFSQVLPMRL